MKAGFCLLIQLFVQNAQSEPDTNVHVYIPPEQRPEQQPEQQEQQPDTHHHVYVPPEQHGGEDNKDKDKDKDMLTIMPLVETVTDRLQLQLLKI